jgi:hypothetical protein
VHGPLSTKRNIHRVCSSLSAVFPRDPGLLPGTETSYIDREERRGGDVQVTRTRLEASRVRRKLGEEV